MLLAAQQHRYRDSQTPAGVSVAPNHRKSMHPARIVGVQHIFSLSPVDPNGPGVGKIAFERLRDDLTGYAYMPPVVKRRG